MSQGFLLDTHTLIWWLRQAERLSSRAFDAISDGAIDIHVSAVSAMEIATKYRIGKLALAEPFAGRLVDVVAAEGFCPLAIQSSHGDQAGSFVAKNQDPWDRLLAAQAKLESLTLITNDGKMDDFGISLYW